MPVRRRKQNDDLTKGLRGTAKKPKMKRVPVKKRKRNSDLAVEPRETILKQKKKRVLATRRKRNSELIRGRFDLKRIRGRERLEKLKLPGLPVLSSGHQKNSRGY